MKKPPKAKLTADVPGPVVDPFKTLKETIVSSRMAFDYSLQTNSQMLCGAILQTRSLLAERGVDLKREDVQALLEAHFPWVADEVVALAFCQGGAYS